VAPRPSPQIQFLEEIIALVVDDDAPDRFHAGLIKVSKLPIAT
jgi:hypothetical protein